MSNERPVYFEFLSSVPSDYFEAVQNGREPPWRKCVVRFADVEVWAPPYINNRARDGAVLVQTSSQGHLVLRGDTEAFSAFMDKHLGVRRF